MPGFYIIESTPIDLVFDIDTLKPIRICVLLMSPLYPTAIVGKFNLPDMTFKEFYPWQLAEFKTAEESVAPILKGKSCIKCTPVPGIYYAVDSISKEITSYYIGSELGLNSAIGKYDYKSRKFEQTYLNIFSDEVYKNAKLKNFIAENMPSYGWAYCDPLTYEFRKILLGWNIFTEQYKSLAEEFSLHDMIVATKEESARWVASVSS